MSRYTPEEKRTMLEDIARVLADTDPANRDVADPERAAEVSSWPFRGPLIPTVSSRGLDQWRAEQLELEAERRDAREQQRAESEQRERRLMTERAQHDESWNRWAIDLIRHELDEHDRASGEAVAKFIVESIDKACRELRDEIAEQLAALRSEFMSSRSDKAVTIIDMPNPLRRRAGDAA